MPRNVPALVLSEDQRPQLNQWLAALGTPQQVALRCRIVLGLGTGRAEGAMATENQVNRKTVRLCRERCHTQGVEGVLITWHEAEDGALID